MKFWRFLDKLTEFYIPIMVGVMAFYINSEYRDLKENVDYIRRHV